MRFSVEFLQDEYFWGGAVANATDMPVCAASHYYRDFTRDPENQMQPFFVSNKGRYVWSEKSFRVWVEDGKLWFDGDGFELYESGKCLRDAYLAGMEKHFPFNDTRKYGKQLPTEFFRKAQYNTWMEYTYHPTQQRVLAYAHEIIKRGFEPGILIIDEGWHTRYGLWEFDRYKFPDPKAMVDELHDMGFVVMLWVTPLVTPDGQQFVLNTRECFGGPNWNELFLRNKAGEVALVEWWNGYSAVLDLRKACDQEYLETKLQFLMKEYGIDGFKFDGGSYGMYHPDQIINGPACGDHDPESLNRAWNEFGARYKFHEYKDTFKGGGRAMIQRLCDRGHLWDKQGINTLIPCAILQGLMGYPYICPDMIGGGEWLFTVTPGFEIDEELFVRMAQASALFPMMQFSWAPWRVLSETSFKLVQAAERLHVSMADKMIELVKNAGETGEPIVRCLEYNDPRQGYETITDEFMLGEDILVCPVVTKGTRKRTVTFPKGCWRDTDGNIYAGRTVVVMESPTEKLLWFYREEKKNET